MTSKERVYRTIRGKGADKPPRFIWVGSAVEPKLCSYYSIEPDKLNAKIGNDVMQTWLSVNREMEHKAAQGERFTDEWGIVWERQGYYNMVVHHPMSGMEASELRKYKVPDVFSGDRFTEFDRLLKEYGSTHFIGADISGSIFEPAYHLRGMEELLMDIASESEEADVILDMITQQTIKIAQEAVKRGADWVWLGDDMGTQNNMIMSPEMWRKYFKPRMKKIIDAIRTENADIIIAYHSCGSIRSILPELIELGIDVINPLQESAANMNHNEIRELLGEKATMFCGLDTQTFMVNASPAEVHVATLDMVARLSKNEHFICGVSHTLQPDIPVQNIAAMIDALDSL